jgi:hypothetical protein
MKQGIIYKLSLPSGKEYIGQTTQEFHQRLTKHFSKARRDTKSGCIALNAAIRKYGEDSVSSEVLLICNETELDYYERKAIELHNTLSPNGYNLMNGGNSNKTMSEKTRKRMSESAKKRDSKPYRKKIESLDLPKYMIHFKNSRYEGYKISKHPLCESKYFCSKKKDMNEKLLDAMSFLCDLEENGIKVEKKISNLPKGIQKYGRGYRIYHTLSDETKYIKNFDQKEYSNEENLKRAKEFLDDLIINS